MAWVRGDDGAKDNRRVLRAGYGGLLPDAAVGLEPEKLERAAVYGFLSLCVAWSARDYSDLFLPEIAVREVCGPHLGWFVQAAIKAGFLAKRSKDAEGDWGWQVIDNGDELFHIRSREEVDIDRARRSHNRNTAENLRIRARDGDQCRYCLRTVVFGRGGDKMTARAGCYDQVIPGDPSLRVVTCKGCNEHKGPRTPEQAGMVLEDPPDFPWYNDVTLAYFAKHNATADLLPAGPDPDQKQSQSKANGEQSNEQEQPNSTVPQQAPRVGSVAGIGRDGPGRDQAPGRAVVPLHPRHGDEGPGAA